MTLYAEAFDCSVEGLALDALTSESEAEWWDSEVRKQDPKLADKINDKMMGAVDELNAYRYPMTAQEEQEWRDRLEAAQKGEPIIREILRNPEADTYPEEPVQEMSLPELPRGRRLRF